MSKLLRYGLAAILVILAAAIAAPFLIPADTYRARIEGAAYAQTGRVLKISGPLHVTVFPSLGVRADGVTLANVPGGHAPYFAAMNELRVAVRLLPLISGRIEVSEVEADKPVINLERDASGHGNWTFGHAAQNGSEHERRFTTRFSGIRLNDGLINYRNTAGVVRTAEHADLTIGLTALNHPVTLDGEVIYAKRRVALEARIGSLAPLRFGQDRDLNVSLTSDLLQASFKGVVAAAGDLAGSIKIDTTNAPAVAEWLGGHLPEVAALHTVSLEGHLETRGAAVTLPEESLRLDGMTVTGRLGIDLSGPRPDLTGDVVIDRLDLNRYIETRPPAGPPQPHVESAAGNGWSTTPVNLSILHRFDGTLAIDTGVLRVRGLHINKTHIVASLADGLLNVTLDPMSLYGGTGKAQLSVDVRGAVPQFHNTLAFDAVSMRALLNDSIGAQRLQGRGTLFLDVMAQGTNTAAVMHDVSGKGTLRIANGQIEGVDLGIVARVIRSTLTLNATGDQAATPFAALGASFVIAHGVLATRDFRLDGPSLRASGTGTVDLGDRSLDLLVKPKAVLLPIGGGYGVGFPFRVHGPWHALLYTPDIAGAVTDLVSDIYNGAVSLPQSIGSLFGGTPEKPKPDDKPKKKTGFFDRLFGH